MHIEILCLHTCMCLLKLFNSFFFLCVIVRSEADVLDESLTFAPSFTHQVFGEREVVFGYKNLKIKVHCMYMCSGRYMLFIL